VETFTFLFTDIEGSTVLLRRLRESLYAQVLADYRSLIRSGLAAHGGREVDTSGDGLFAVFPSPSACLAAAIDTQAALETHAWPGGEHVLVRMGIHTGEASQTATGLIGLDVHRAARVAAVGYGGQVLLSETAATLVRDSLPAWATLEDLGFHRLKDLGRPEHIFQLRAPGLQAEFPPLRSLGNPALLNNLPAQQSTFVGRARELSEVGALVESSRLVTLTGAGGCGKTRLSLQVAAELLDGSGDGVWLVELAAVSDPDAVPSFINEALGIAPQAGRPALEALLDALAPQDLLIVLDNCEHLIDACAKTADALLRRCPRVHLVATSREPLAINGETIYRVPSLSLPVSGGAEAPESSDAVALFLDRTRAQGAGLTVNEETLPVIVSVCQRLDGLPLAIELAAARLRSLSLTGLHDRLDQRFRLLTGGSRTALARQQTLRATVDWSYSLLNGAEQSVLRRLSVFAESFDLDAAEAVCGFGDIEVFDVAELLGALVDKSLVVAEPAGDALRYRLLETIRQFAAERLAEAGENEAAAVAAAHGQHYLSLAEAAAPHLKGSDQGSWYARLDADQPNLRRAAWYLVEIPGGTEQVLRLVVALDRYWIARGRDQDGLVLLTPVLERPEARTDPVLYGDAVKVAAILSRVSGIASALRYGERAVELARRLDDGRLLIEALAVLSSLCHFAGQAERGLLLGQEAVERARPLSDDVLLAEAMSGYVQCVDLADPVRSGKLYDEAIACTERSGDLLFAGFLHNDAGVHALRVGDIPAARAHLEAAAQASRAIGEHSSPVAINLGWVRRQDGDADGARSSFEDALRMSRRSGEHFDIAYAVLGLACLAADAGEWSRACALHGIAQAALDRTGEPWQEPEAGYRGESLAQIRAQIGAEQSERGYARGLALGPDGIAELATRQDLLPARLDAPEPTPLGDHVDPGDRVAVEREPQGSDQPSGQADGQAGGAVHERRTDEPGAARELERVGAHRLGPAHGRGAAR
jgi:predicted ATPase/class 3 adenylate cyclase